MKRACVRSPLVNLRLDLLSVSSCRDNKIFQTVLFLNLFATKVLVLKKPILFFYTGKLCEKIPVEMWCFNFTCLLWAVHMKIVFPLFWRLTEKKILFPRMHVRNIFQPGLDLFWRDVSFRNFARSKYLKWVT